MLIYRFSPPFMSLPVTHAHLLNFPDDTLRCLLHDLCIYKLCCLSSIRDMMIEEMLPVKMKGIPASYDGTLAEYQLMIRALDDLRLFIILKREDNKVNKILNNLLKTTIRVLNNELCVSTPLEDLLAHLKTNCECNNSKFRTLSNTQ